MKTMRWLRVGRSARGTPLLRPWLRRQPLALVVLAAVALVQTGCQSGFFGPCSPCSGVRNLRERVFRPFNRSAGCCGGAVVPEGAAVEYGAPAVVAPAVPLGPATGPSPSVVVPPAGATESTPSHLAPAEPPPSAAPGPPPSSESTGAKSPTGKANYEAYRPRNRPSRSGVETLAKTEIPTLEPAPQSAQGSAPSNRADPLDNLPPIALSKEVPFNDVTPPDSPPAERDSKPSAAASDSRVEAATPVASTTALTSVNVTPGLRRFASFEPKLAGGSVPTNEGLDWLVEKGYKTILDLREPGEAQSSFIAEVSNRGLRYVALPITVKNLDADHVSRFNSELSLSDARPLYFCDTDGTRAGILWYVRRMTKEKMDPQVASREAEQMGQIDKAFWRAASAYLESLKPVASPAPSEPDPAGAPKPNTGSQPDDPKAKPSSSGANKPLASAATEPGTIVADAESNPAESNATASASDPTAWRSYAALMITGLVVPLAYWSRASLPSLRSLRRASLAAPARRSKSLPSSSDV